MKAHPDSIRNYDTLYALYTHEQLSPPEIGKLLGVNPRLILTWLAKFGIETRTRSQAAKLFAQKYLDKRVTGLCSTCGKEFKLPLYRRQRAKKLYCSRGCQIQDHAMSLEKARAILRVGHPRHQKICPICAAAFTVPFSHGRRKHCSDRCKGVAQMMANGHHKATPNMIERRIEEITSRYFPDFKYNGNGNLGVALGGMIPDFVNTNGKKQVIEVFGDYYHGERNHKWNQSELGRIMAYNALGYKCLIIWEHDIKTKAEDEIVGLISQSLRLEVHHG